MDKPKVLFTSHDMPQIAFDLLQDHCEIIVIEDKPVANRESILAKVPGVYAIIWSLRKKLDKEMLDAAGPQLRIISSFSAGVDFMDVEDVKARGILIGNTRDILNDAVADLAVLLTLAATRRLEEARRSILSESTSTEIKWMLGTEIRNSTIGIVGLGGIGTACLHRFKGFKVGKFIYCGHKEKSEGKAAGASFVSYETLLRESDIILVTCPLTDETRNMFDAAAFSKMKPSTVFINVGRAAVVDQDALIEALETNKIFAAGLDVTNPEPLPKNHKLLTLPNCVITPHLGNATIQTRSDMAKMAAENVLCALNNKPLISTPFM